MDKTTLVESDVKQGEELIKVLHDEGFPIHLALWLYRPDRYAELRLVIATPVLDEKGPIEAYKEVMTILKRRHSNLLPLFSHIQIVSPTDSLIRAVRKTFPPGRKILDPVISGNTSGTYIEYGHLYNVPEGTG